MESSRSLLDRQPLAGRSPRDRHALHRASGMHSPYEATRIDADAFELRADVSVEDACVTSLRLVRAAVAQLELLSMDAGLGAAHREAVDGIACLARLACGALGLVDAALHDQPPPESAHDHQRPR